MFVNKSIGGRNNACGEKVAELRKGMNISQRELADRLTGIGLALDKNAIQRIECGKRYVTDIELSYISKVLNVSINTLLGLA